MSLVEICLMSHLVVVQPLPSKSHRSPVLDHQASHHQTFLPQCLLTLLFPVILCDSARAACRSESAKLDVTLTACDQLVGICVSRCEMSEGSQVDPGREVSWNGSDRTVSCLDDEPASALA